jgi:allantoate deiminase
LAIKRLVSAKIEVDFQTLALRVIARCAELAQLTETPGMLTRTFLSPAIRDCHRLIAAWTPWAICGVFLQVNPRLRMQSARDC